MLNHIKISGKDQAQRAINWATLSLYGILVIFAIFSLMNMRGEFTGIRIFILHYILISIVLLFLIRLKKSRLATILLLLIQPFFRGWYTFPLMLRSLWGLVLFIFLITGAAYTLYAAIAYQKLEPASYTFRERFYSKIVNKDQSKAVLNLSFQIIMVMLAVFFYFSVWVFMYAGLPFYRLINFLPFFVLVMIIKWTWSRIASLLLVLTIGAWIMNISFDSNKLSFLNDFSFLKHWPLTIFLILALLISIRLLQTTIAFHRHKK